MESEKLRTIVMKMVDCLPEDITRNDFLQIAAILFEAGLRTPDGAMKEGE